MGVLSRALAALPPQTAWELPVSMKGHSLCATPLHCLALGPSRHLSTFLLGLLTASGPGTRCIPAWLPGPWHRPSCAAGLDAWLEV